MPQDALNYQYLTYELNNILVQGRIEKIFMPEKSTIVLSVKNGKSYPLLISCNPTCARMAISYTNIENPLTPFSFLMHLRKRLIGGIITDILQVPYERVIKIFITAKTPLGDTEKYTLVVEIMGKYSNILLVDENEIITECVFHSPDMTAKRLVLPGIKYSLPPSQDKFNIEQKDQLITYFSTYNEGSLSKFIMKKLYGLAPSSINEAIYNLGDDKSPNNIYNKLNDLYNKQTDACIYEENNVVKDYSAFPYNSININKKSCPTISKAMDDYFYSIANQNHFSGMGKQLINTVKTALSHSTKKLDGFYEKLAQCQDLEQDKLIGELLTSYIYLIKMGMSEITVNNYYTNQDITISLDPGLSPQANANKHYKTYNKKKKTISFVTEQIEITKNEIEYYESLIEEFRNITSNSELNDFKQELIQANLIKIKTNKKAKNTVSKPITLTIDGYIVKIGKNNLQNDILVKKARDNYIWLHPQKIHGSHTIIEGEDVPLSTIEKVARFSAFYSKAYQSDNVPIDYTLVKYVKKPANALPGKVIYTHQKTVFAHPTKPENI